MVTAEDVRDKKIVILFSNPSFYFSSFPTTTTTTVSSPPTLLLAEGRTDNHGNGNGRCGAIMGKVNDSNGDRKRSIKKFVIKTNQTGFISKVSIRNVKCLCPLAFPYLTLSPAIYPLAKILPTIPPLSSSPS